MKKRALKVIGVPAVIGLATVGFVMPRVTDLGNGCYAARISAHGARIRASLPRLLREELNRRFVASKVCADAKIDC